MAPCGALRSSTNDMLKFLSAQLVPTETNLSPAIEATHTVHYEVEPGSSICLAWNKDNFGDVDILWHNGGTYGHSSFTGFIKEKGIGVIILSNTCSFDSFDIDLAGFWILLDLAWY